MYFSEGVETLVLAIEYVYTQEVFHRNSFSKAMLSKKLRTSDLRLEFQSMIQSCLKSYGSAFSQCLIIV